MWLILILVGLAMILFGVLVEAAQSADMAGCYSGGCISGAMDRPQRLQGGLTLPSNSKGHGIFSVALFHVLGFMQKRRNL